MFFLKRSLVWQLVGNPVYSRDSTSNSLVLLSPIFAWPLLQPTMFFLKRSLIWSGWCSCLFRGFYFKQSGTFICISLCSNDVLLQTVPSIPPMSWYPVNKLTHIYIYTYIYRFVLNLSSLYIDHYSMLVRWGSVLWDFHLKNKDYAESTVRFTAPLRERLSCGRSSPCLLVSLEKGRCMQMSRGPWKICWLNPHLSSLIWVNRRQFQHSTLASNAQTHGRHYPQSYTHNIVKYIYIYIL